MVVVLIKEIVPHLLSRLTIERQLAADLEARRQFYTSRPRFTAVEGHTPLAFIQVLLCLIRRRSFLAVYRHGYTM